MPIWLRVVLQPGNRAELSCCARAISSRTSRPRLRKPIDMASSASHSLRLLKEVQKESIARDQLWAHRRIQQTCFQIGGETENRTMTALQHSKNGKALLLWRVIASQLETKFPYRHHGICQTIRFWADPQGKLSSLSRASKPSCSIISSLDWDLTNLLGRQHPAEAPHLAGTLSGHSSEHNKLAAQFVRMLEMALSENRTPTKILCLSFMFPFFNG